MLLGRAQIAGMIPHTGKMSLLDEVLRWDESTIRCRTGSHRDADNPLCAGGQLPALCGIEYAAQAMALHGRLAALVARTPRAGYIASVSDILCSATRLDQFKHHLLIDAERLASDEECVLYRFTLSAGGAEFLRGKAVVVLDAQGPPE